MTGGFDSYRGADSVLASEGFRATMFVITGPIADRNPFYLNWTELHRMRDSGRWDIQPHAYRGHVQVTVDSRGDQRPFYAMRRWLRSTGEETFAAYQRRVGRRPVHARRPVPRPGDPRVLDRRAVR